MTAAKQCVIKVAGTPQINDSTAALRDAWEETSFVLERLQSSEETVSAEQSGLKDRKAPVWKLPFTPAYTPEAKLQATNKVGHVGRRGGGTGIRYPVCWWACS